MRDFQHFGANPVPTRNSWKNDEAHKKAMPPPAYLANLGGHFQCFPNFNKDDDLRGKWEKSGEAFRLINAHASICIQMSGHADVSVELQIVKPGRSMDYVNVYQCVRLTRRETRLLEPRSMFQ